MADALDNAASAFDVAMGNNSSSDRGGSGGAKETAVVETMFDGLGVLDDDSPEAGGDKSDDRRAAKAAARKPVEEDQDDLEDPLLAQSDDDSGDADGEGDEEGAGEDEDDDGAAKNADDEDEEFYEVVVDGERKEVGLREALDGYIRQETFYTRLNELNAVREALSAEAVKILDQRKTYTAKLEEVEQLLTALVPNEPNWVEEYKRDPEGAAVIQRQYNQLQEQIKAIRGAKAKTENEVTAEDENARKEFIRKENAKIFNNHPHWKDETVRARDLAAMAQTAMAAGFPQEEVLKTVDSRMITLLYKAMKYDKIQANKPKPVRRGNKTVAPGSGSNRTAPKGLSKASQQLRKTGSVEAAGAVFANIINPRR